MTLIFYSLLVLMSALRLWNMSFKLAGLISVDMQKFLQPPPLVQAMVENTVFKY